MKTRRKILGALGALALLAGACGGDDDDVVAEQAPTAVPDDTADEETSTTTEDAAPDPTETPEPEPEPEDENEAEPEPPSTEPAPVIAGLPDGRGNNVPRAATFSEVTEVDLDWQEVDLGVELLDQPLIVNGAIVVATADHDWVASTDGVTWETIIEWDRPAKAAFGPDAWYLLTGAEDAAIEFQGDTFYTRWQVLRSSDLGVTWVEIPLDVEAEQEDGLVVFLDQVSIATAGDAAVVLLSEVVFVEDWEAQLREAGLASDDETVYLLAPDGPAQQARIIGPDRDETITISADDLGIDPGRYDEALGSAPPAGLVLTSVDGAPFERVDVETFGLFAVEQFEDGVRLFGFGQEVTSTDGVTWEPLDTGGLELNWGIDGWWIGAQFGPTGGALTQSLDGGSTFDEVPLEIPYEFPQFVHLGSTGAGAVLTETGIGEGSGEGITLTTDDGFVYDLDGDFLLTITDPAGAVVVDGAVVFDGIAPDNLIVTVDGLVLVDEVGTPLSTISLDELFSADPVGFSAGASWAVWSRDGASWFADLIDFSPVTIVIPLGDVVVALPAFGSGVEPVRVARVGG